MKEPMINFSKPSKPARTLNENKFEKIKECIEKPVEDKPWCKKIEIKIPGLLLRVQWNLDLTNLYITKSSV